MLNFSEDDYNFINKINDDFIKIPSGEINNFFLLDKINKLRKKIILSTGASSYSEISKSVNFIRKKIKKTSEEIFMYNALCF